MNTNESEKGFGVIEIMILLAVIAVVGLIGWKVMGQKTEESSQQQESKQEQRPLADTTESEPDLILQNIGVDEDDILYDTHATREFISQGLKGFYVFGDALPGGRVNPNFEFASLKSSTKVVSAIDGVVTFVREQSDSSDMEVFVQPKEGSQWTIGYDHLINLSVKKGDSVKAGDILGEPARQNNGLLRFEIQINKDVDGETTHYCPSTLLSSSVKDEVLESLKTIQNQWESASALELYNLDQQNPVGCIKQTLTPSEAEGA